MAREVELQTTITLKTLWKELASLALLSLLQLQRLPTCHSHALLILQPMLLVIYTISILVRPLDFDVTPNVESGGIEVPRSHAASQRAT